MIRPLSILIAFVITSLSAVAITSASHGEKLSLPTVFGNNMMLQQNSIARIWGWGKPGAKVTAVPSWCAECTANAIADEKTGRWELTVSTPKASFDAQTILVTDSIDSIAIKNVLIGEVWLCSGQSNMEMPLRGFWAQPIEGASQAIAYSGKYTGIRFFTVPKSGSYDLKMETEGEWLECNPANAPEFSALAYFFAQSLTDILNVPVGIICCAYGGTKLESWLPEEITRTYSDIDLDSEKNGTAKVDDWHKATIRFNSMLHPLVGYSIKGFLWNQGESNVGAHATYPSRMAIMVNTWRELWGDPTLPFYQVEIPGWNYGNPDGTDAALFREAQHKASDLISNCDIVSTVDLLYDFELEDIHARRKQPIGERLAFMAAAETYGMPTIAHIYPMLTSIKIDGNKAVMRFDNVDGFLTPNDALEGFEVAGEDHQFYPASTIMEAGTYDVVATAPNEVKEIKSVRYCFKNFNIGKVHSMQGLPLIPFRTDNWEK